MLVSFGKMEINRTTEEWQPFVSAAERSWPAQLFRFQAVCRLLPYAGAFAFHVETEAVCRGLLLWLPQTLPPKGDLRVKKRPFVVKLVFRGLRPEAEGHVRLRGVQLRTTLSELTRSQQVRVPSLCLTQSPARQSSSSGSGGGSSRVPSMAAHAAGLPAVRSL